MEDFYDILHRVHGQERGHVGYKKKLLHAEVYLFHKHQSNSVWFYHSRFLHAMKSFTVGCAEVYEPVSPLQFSKTAEPSCAP